MTKNVQNAVATLFIALFVLICLPNSTKAQNKKDEKAIKEVMAKFEETWNKGDLDSFVELFATDAEFTNPKGKRANRRDDIKKHHAFIGSKTIKIHFDNIRVKLYTKDVATVDAEHTISGFVGDDGKPFSYQTLPLHILKKLNGKWLISVLHVVFNESPASK